MYYKMIDPKASTMRRLTVARVLLVGVAIVAAGILAVQLSRQQPGAEIPVK